jgi:pimeloyl-ACP methyl ester carboxylesterase
MLVRMSEIRVNGVSLYYEEHGSGEPILCIHGTGSSTELWREPARVLAARGRTIVYDRRGFGRSERPEPFVTNVHLQTDDAAALLHALGAAPAVVIGRSQGGEIAADLALRYPDRVRALALLEGGGLSLSPAFRRWLARFHERLFAAAEADPATVGEALLRGVLGDGAWESLPERVQRVFTANGPAIVAEERGGMLDVGAVELATIAQPTLIVGARDSGPEFAEATELTAKAMPAARVAWVEGGHLIDAAHPAVLGFVDEVLARAATPAA